jgi:septal ring factor EnvC (AmiA/AmiB activator)
MKNTSYRLFLITCLALISMVALSPVQAQTSRTRADLEREKAEIQAKLKEFDAILRQTTANKKETIGSLNAVTRQYQTQSRLVSTLDREVKVLDSEIQKNEDDINRLENDLKELKAEYARMIYNSSKLNRNLSIVAFVFSSNNFNQLYMRLKYLKQYTDSRKQQAAQIQALSLELAKEKEQLEIRKQDKEKILAEAQRERQKLEAMRREQQGIVNTLTKKEKSIRSQITATKKQQQQLESMIRKAIEEEIRLAEAAAKKENSTATKAAGSSLPMTPEVAALSSSFAGNRGRLPWPVETGFISQTYGDHPHPTLRGITVPSDGINIRTQPNSNVRTVFDGTVAKVASMPGYGETVLIKHGEYYTLYTKLQSTSVKVGQVVKAKDVIGRVATNSDGEAEIHFQTWKGLQKMDPASWISSR